MGEGRFGGGGESTTSPSLPRVSELEPRVARPSNTPTNSPTPPWPTPGTTVPLGIEIPESGPPGAGLWAGLQHTCTTPPSPSPTVRSAILQSRPQPPIFQKLTEDSSLLSLLFRCLFRQPHTFKTSAVNFDGKQ